MAKIFHTTEQLSPRQRLTPEGFLLCEEVPLARTGEMLYAAHERPGLDAGRDGIVHVTRDEADVFHDTAMASFMGKPVIIGHPRTHDGKVNPRNWKQLAVGSVQNVRRGAGNTADLLIGDLLITDAAAIAEIRAGKREVSCGYTCDYEQEEAGRARQSNIIGNHVALVERGRCGSRCAIGDEAMKPTLYTRIKNAFSTQDSAAMDAVLNEIGGEGANEDGEQHITVNVHGAKGVEATHDAEALNSLVERVDALTTIVSDLVQGNKTTADAAAAETAKAAAAKAVRIATVDANGVKTAFQLTMARAEILAPGVKLLTLDAAADLGATVDALCEFRRSTLLKAYSTDTGKAAISAVSDEADLVKALPEMTCDAVLSMFNSAAAIVKQGNTLRSSGRGGINATQSRTKVPTPAEINEMNRKFHAGRSKSE